MSKNNKAVQCEPVAVVGIGSLYPGAHDINSYWRTITEGDDKMQQVPGSYWLPDDFYNPEPGVTDRVYTDRGAFIDPVDLDVLDTGVTPNNLSSTDVSQLLALHVARQVLNDAGFLHDETLRARTSVILGVAGATEMMSAMSGRLGEPVWRHALKESGLPEAQVDELVTRILDYFPKWQETTFPGLLGNVIAGRIANRLDLHGTNCVVDAACASSFSALSMAINELHMHQSDLVLTGGVDALNHPLMYMCFAQTGALSRTGDCRPFSDQADGTMMGEGIGMLALRRLADAEHDGDMIYAIIRSCGSSSDGSSKSVYAPVADGQAIALKRAYAMADYSPQTVELMEAHGTATVAGDAAEFAGLKSVFQAETMDKQWCALGSVKSQIGHTKGAAGAAGLIKSILALRQKVLPPTIKVDRLNPKLDVENSPFYINTQSRPWVRSAEHPRRASANALGFGGSNFHVTVEEYTGSGNKPPRLQVSPVEAIVLSSNSIEDAIQQCRQLHDTELLPGSLRYLAYSTQHEVDLTQQVKVVLLVKSETALSSQTEKAITILQQHLSDSFEIIDEGVFVSNGIKTDKTALLFPGQGSQYVGMGGELAMFLPEAQAVWDRAATALNSHAPHYAVFPPPAMDDSQRQTQEQFLRRSEQAQPALGVCALANWKILKKMGVTADALAGHSFGEVVALHVAGVFDEADFFNIAMTRGKLMATAAASSEGSMSAVIGDKDIVKQVVNAIGDGLVIANDNSPAQSVISGSTESVSQAEQQLQQQGLRVIRLPVATAFHSSIVADASEPFLDVLKDITFHKPDIPVIACSTAEPYTATASVMRKTLAEQLTKTVRFTEQIDHLYAMGVRNFIEVGAGNILSNLTNECLHDKTHRTIACDQKNEHGVISLYNALAHLTIAGCSINWPALWDGVVIPHDPACKQKSPLSKSVDGHNIDRPYPPQADATNLHPAMEYFTRPVQQPDKQQEDTMKNNDLQSAASQNAQQNKTNVPTKEKQADMHHVLLAAQQQYQASMQAMQQSMTDAHLNYLKAVQGILGETNDSMQTPAQPKSPKQTVFTPPQPQAVSTSIAAPAPAHVMDKQTEMETVADTETSPTIKKSIESITDKQNVVELFLDVVSDKTGYPREVLELDMEMEGGLGIDSIKRVEILAELQNQLPGLTNLDASQLSSLSTLREVVDSVEQAMGTPTDTKMQHHESASKPRDIVALFLDVVADKTGYPREVLELDMEMESGLGIDSIKRVEILAELQNQLPDLAELNAAQLASLSTLQEVVDSVEQTLQAGEIIEQVIEQTSQTKKKRPYEGIYRHILRLEKVTANGFVTPGLFSDGVIAITGDDIHLATELQTLLNKAGLNVQHFRTLESLPKNLTGLIYLQALHNSGDAKSGISQQIAAVKSLQQAGPTLQKNQGFLVLTQTGSGDFGLQESISVSPWNRGLIALARTARLEWPQITTRFIDCDSQDGGLAQTIFTELLNGSNATEIALQNNGDRYQPVDKALQPEAGELPLAENAVIVVAGGGRGVTAACMIELAKQQRFRFALLGRSELVDEPAICANANSESALIKVLSTAKDRPDLSKVRQQAKAILASREIHETMHQIQSTGSEAKYYCTDIQDSDRVEETLHQIRQKWAGIHGLIHAAGVLADKYIVDKTEQQLESVMQTKLRGIETLLEATQDDALQLIVMFSSVAARYGNVGQCDYAMANETLNQLALYLSQQRPDCRVKSLMWGPWDGGMVTPALKKQFVDRQIPLIDLQQGSEWFVDELKQDDEILVVLGEGRELSKATLPQTAQKEFSVLVSSQQQPYLVDHTINGKVVLPVVQVIEWFLRAASDIEGDYQSVGIEDFQVLSGIKLSNFAEQQLLLHINVKKIATHRYEAILTDTHYKPCHRATVVFDPQKESPTIEFTKPAASLNPWPIDVREAYDTNHLFHGPAFQVIHELGSIGEDGCVLQINTDIDKQWHGAPYLSSPALIDGCLQISVLWGQCLKQQNSLPIRINRIQWYRQDDFQRITCCYAKIWARENKLQSDILAVDAQGQPLVVLEGVDNIIYSVKSEAL